ncbi:RICIN domain-containing protein [Nonomuraea sp. NPDC052129]|uniref:RICIN domain-containing protein n=1 Tax=Nonomuraea sp. NPDC052129 TaxID=3154651 RepID=UPI00342DE7CC
MLRNISRAVTGLMALFLAGAASIMIANSASAAVPSGHRQIRNAAYSQCVDAPGGVLNVRLKLAPCSRLVSTRLWTFVPTGVADTYFVVNVASGDCMEVNDGTSTPGETVDEFTCNGSASEQWVVDGLTLRHAGTNQCLDTVSGRGSELMQFTCGQAAPPGAQSWIIE